MSTEADAQARGKAEKLMRRIYNAISQRFESKVSPEPGGELHWDWLVVFLKHELLAFAAGERAAGEREERDDWQMRWEILQERLQTANDYIAAVNRDWLRSRDSRSPEDPGEPAQPEPPHFHGVTACWGKVTDNRCSGWVPGPAQARVSLLKSLAAELAQLPATERWHRMENGARIVASASSPLVGASGGSPTICPEAPPNSAIQAGAGRCLEQARVSPEEEKCLRHGIYCQGGSGQVVDPVAACRAWDPPKFAADPERWDA